MFHTLIVLLQAGDHALFLGRMVYLAKEAGNSLHYSDEFDYALRVDMKVGKVKETEIRLSVRNSFNYLN